MTNLQHALMNTARHLRPHPDAERLVLVVIDRGADRTWRPDSSPYFRWPRTAATLQATVRQVDKLTR